LPPLRLARGVYYSYAGRVPFNHLIYPVPEKSGLGVHLTLDLAGNARFGPNVEWVDRVEYSLPPDPARDTDFRQAAHAIWPQLDTAKLAPSFAGIRPKLSGPADPPADFLLLGPGDHGLPNLSALFGIESPGLTASLALASEVAMQLGLSPAELEPA
jgi:L-2-hydroxyglutarate oxidase LhgO